MLDLFNEIVIVSKEEILKMFNEVLMKISDESIK